MTGRIKLIVVLALVAGAWSAVSPKPNGVDAGARAAGNMAVVREFLQTDCYACHAGTTKKGNLDLSALKPDLEDAQSFAVWVKVHDRVRALEMPPKSMPQPDEAARAAFLKALAEPMIAADESR